MGTVKRVSQRINIKKPRKMQSKWRPKKKYQTYTSPGRILGLTNRDYGFPDRLSTKLIYCDTVALTNTSGGVGYNTFRLNSCYDPDLTNVGHQPQWWDQLTTVYNNYRVKGAKITVTFCSIVNATTTGPYVVGITTSSTSTLSASSNYSLEEDANGTNAILEGPTGSNNVKTLSSTYSPLRDCGVDPYDDTLQAVYNASPSRLYYAHVWAKDLATANTGYVYATIKLEMQVEMFNRIEGVIS